MPADELKPNIVFTQAELDEIYDSAVNGLENVYQDDFEDVDLANEPVDMFSERKGLVLIWQSIVKKIGGETI